MTTTAAATGAAAGSDPAASTDPTDPRPSRPLREGGSQRLLVAAVVGAVLAAAVVLRIVSSGPLWLDESLSVEIARRPLGPMFTALRHDGSPPLYYLLLHGWVALFGTGTSAVRALSSVISLACLPLAWRAGRRVGGTGNQGRRTALAMLLLTATAPYALRYSTETRMYGLLLLLTLAAIPLLADALEHPTWPRLAGVTVVSTLLAYTHYWAFYLLIPVALAVAWRRQWRVLAAMAAAIVPYAPWLPSLLFQLRHTGTPWASTPSVAIIGATLQEWGGSAPLGLLLAFAFVMVAVVGLTALPPAGGVLRLDLRGRPGMRLLAALALAPLVVAMLLGLVTHAGYAARYTAVCLPFFLLLLARGVTVLPRRASQTVLSVLCAGGLLSGAVAASSSRTEAGTIAGALLAQAGPGAVVGYCPDQLAPAVHRVLGAHSGLTEIAYADPEGPALVDWVDYSQRVHALRPARFAAELLTRSGGRGVYLVEQDGYRVFDQDCTQVAQALSEQRGQGEVAVLAHQSLLEHATLLRFGPAS